MRGNNILGSFGGLALGIRHIVKHLLTKIFLKKHSLNTKMSSVRDVTCDFGMFITPFIIYYEKFRYSLPFISTRPTSGEVE